MDPIHFQCPVCQASLTLPPAAAGRRGPCPHCKEDIIGPDPARGFPARPALIESPPPETIEPATKATKTPRAPEPRKTDPKSGSATNPGSPNPSRRSGYSGSTLFIACLICSVLAFVGGLLIGGSSRNREAFPPIWSPKPVPTKQVPPKQAPPTEDPEEAPEEPSPGQDSASLKKDRSHLTSKQCLEAFLIANTWDERLQHASKAISKKNSITPIEFSGLTIRTESPTTHVYQLVTPEHPYGLPVILHLETDGWRVDWQHFHEHHQDLFKRFASGEGPQESGFQLLVFPDKATKHHPSSIFASYRLSPALPDRIRLAYVKRGTLAHRRLEEASEPHQEPDPADITARAADCNRIILSFNRNSQDQEFLLVEDFPPGSNPSSKN